MDVFYLSDIHDKHGVNMMCNMLLIYTMKYELMA